MLKIHTKTPKAIYISTGDLSLGFSLSLLSQMCSIFEAEEFLALCKPKSSFSNSQEGLKRVYNRQGNVKQGGRQESRALIVDRQKAFGRNLIAHDILRHLLHVFNCHLQAMTHVKCLRGTINF